MFQETTFRGAKILQFELLLERSELFHAIFLSDTPFAQIETLIDEPTFKIEQIHSSRVLTAPANEPGDGLITDDIKKALLIRHADCQAAIFYDPVVKRLGVIHAGWRGLVKEIYTETIKQFKSGGSLTENLLVAIGPSLGPERGEFRGWKEYFPPYFEAFQTKEDHFDLREVARFQLLSQGVLPHHLAISSLCTYQDRARFHSWRRDKNQERLGTLAFMRDN